MFKWFNHNVKCPTNSAIKKKLRKRDSSSATSDIVDQTRSYTDSPLTPAFDSNFDYISNYERPSRQQPSKINITDQNVFFSDPTAVDDYQLSLSLDSRLANSIKSKPLYPLRLNDESYQREGDSGGGGLFLDNITNTKMIASPTKSSPASNKILTNSIPSAGVGANANTMNHHLVQQQPQQQQLQMPIIQQPQSINNKLISSSSSSSSSASSTSSSSASSSTAMSSSTASSSHHATTPNAITTSSPVNGSKLAPPTPSNNKSTTTPNVNPQTNSSSNLSSPQQQAYLSVPSRTMLAGTVSSPSPMTQQQLHSLSYLDESNLKMAIVDYTDLLKLVKLQNAIDHHEWLAFNTKMYFDQINILYGAISENCTPQTCPTMNAPANTQYHWLDEKNKKCKYSASQYIDTVLTYTAKAISDDSLFPTKAGHAFPASFDAIVKKIHKHLFHVLAHMYHSHYKELLMLQLNGHLNSIYFHFYLFNKSFNLIDEKDLEVLDPLNKCLMAKYLDNSNLSALMSQQSHYQTQSIHSQQLSSNNSSSSGSITSSGFSFLKKKLNFNLMA